MNQMCQQRKRIVLQTLQGMVAEIEAHRLLILAILNERHELISEAITKIAVLENNIETISLSLDFIEESCGWCQCETRKVA